MSMSHYYIYTPQPVLISKPKLIHSTTVLVGLISSAFYTTGTYKQLKTQTMITY